MPEIHDDTEEYEPFNGLLIALAVTKFLSLAYKIYFDQALMDVFMVDWESPKWYRKPGQQPKMAVSPWRKLFVCNEFNEL